MQISGRRLYFLKIFIFPLILLALPLTISQNVSEFKQTIFSFHENGHIKALSQHQVYCAKNQVLTYWKVQQDASSMRINYYCLSGLAILEEITEHYTNYVTIAKTESQSLNALDKYEVKCREDAALNGFNLEYYTSGQIRFRYTCSKVKYASLASYNTSYFRSGTGEVYRLSLGEVKSPNFSNNMQGLQGFIMNLRYPSRVCDTWCIDSNYNSEWDEGEPCTDVCRDTTYNEFQFRIWYLDLRNLPADVSY